jgi:hypothetical protein
VSSSYKAVFRLTVLATVTTALLITDGIVLMATNGLKSDATNVFPVLGGSLGGTTRTSGANILVMAAILALVTIAGWVYCRRLKAAQPGAGAQPAASASAAPRSGSDAVARHDS